MTHANQKHKTPSLRQHLQVRLQKKVHKASPISNQPQLNELVSTRFSVFSLNWIKSAQKKRTATNSLTEKWKKKKNLFHKKKRCNKLWFKTCQSGLQYCRVMGRCRTKEGIKSMQKSYARQTETSSNKSPRRNDKKENRIKATFHQFACFRSHLSLFWIQASSSMCWKDSNTHKFDPLQIGKGIKVLLKW